MVSAPGGLTFFGVVSTSIGILLLANARRRRARWIRVPGLVTDLVPSSDPDSPAKFPTFRFTTTEGHEVKIKSGRGENNPPRPGDNVTVLYDPKEPQRAVIDTTGQSDISMGRWLIGFGLVLLTLDVLTILGVF